MGICCRTQSNDIYRGLNVGDLPKQKQNYSNTIYHNDEGAIIFSNLSYDRTYEVKYKKSNLRKEK